MNLWMSEYRPGRAPRHITGKHGPELPLGLDRLKPGRVLRWLREHPMTGSTTPPRTPEKVRERRRLAAQKAKR